MSKGSRKKRKIRVRRSWKIHPATRVEKDETKYDRKRAKKEMRHLLEDRY